MRKRRDGDPDDAWTPVAPRPKVDEEETPKDDGPTYEDTWYQVLRRSRDEGTAASEPD